MPNPEGKLLATAGGLALLAGALVFLRFGSPAAPVATGRDVPPAASASSVPDQATPGSATAPASPPSPASLSPAPAHDAEAPAKNAPLPAAPSGDFELNLTAEQVGELVDRRYRALFPTLHLSPGELARLRALLIERQQAVIDAANSAIVVGVNPVRDPETIRRIIETTQADADAQLRQEMGEAVFAACNDFDRTTGERNAVGDLARALSATTEPLRPEQARQMMRILTPAPDAGAPADVHRLIFGGPDLRAPISEQALAASTRVLSPAQLAQFRQLQQRLAAADANR